MRFTAIFVFMFLVAMMEHYSMAVDPPIGDIMFTDKQKKQLKNRNAIISAPKWTDGRVPYEVDPAMPDVTKKLIEQAVKAYEQHTCIRWVPKTDTDKYWVVFFQGADGACWSLLGMVGGGQPGVEGGGQPLSLGNGICQEFKVVLHEMMHALGFDHEQNRPDRDEFITVNFQNVPAGLENAFKIRQPAEANLTHLRYDYLSVMHYQLGGWMDSKNPQYQEPTGNMKHFSPCDLDKINIYYNCGPKYVKNNPNCLLGQRVPDFQCSDDRPDVCYSVWLDPTLCDKEPLNLIRCKRTCNNCDGSKCYDSKDETLAAQCNAGACDTGATLRCPKTCGLCKEYSQF